MNWLKSFLKNGYIDYFSFGSDICIHFILSSKSLPSARYNFSLITVYFRSSFIFYWKYIYDNAIWMEKIPLARIELDWCANFLLICKCYVSIGNSMICTDISHEYHEWYFKIVKIWDDFEISRVVFMPNITYKSCY